MNRWLGMPIAAALVLSACVTINVYFPAAEAREAAREFVDNVIGENGRPVEDDGLFPQEPGGMARAPAPASFHPLMLIGIAPAHAQGSPDITIKTPAIDAIRSRMRERFGSALRPHFESGALGFGNDGTVSVRDAGKIPLSDRVKVNQAVADQNRDAQAVYREIAVANGHPEWEGQIREVFAKQWADSARSGWWVQDRSGSWKQK
ncbi:YdbL family protein [Luteimonas sp. SJ-92]|uniref:YdbL family protein n=1 Tax=Luteimonas salinisoli TaxID=2752307 RepID=A0A853JBH6_9GAMM|nr:YdbL family protein [Luteimonas salinisoli]NZA25978.1 YdbL family protein [Luteimonas salinisoli]